MTNTLPDLRLTIAEGMEALAIRQYWDDDREMPLLRGAQTLRWCAAREAPTIEELQAEIDGLTAQCEDAEAIASELVANVRIAARKWQHAEDCATVLAAPIEVECSCGVAKMRKSVLDAVA